MTYPSKLVRYENKLILLFPPAIFKFSFLKFGIPTLHITTTNSQMKYVILYILFFFNELRSNCLSKRVVGEIYFLKIYEYLTYASKP